MFKFLVILDKRVKLDRNSEFQVEFLSATSSLRIEDYADHLSRGHYYFRSYAASTRTAATVARRPTASAGTARRYAACHARAISFGALPRRGRVCGERSSSRRYSQRRGNGCAASGRLAPGFRLHPRHAPSAGESGTAAYLPGIYAILRKRSSGPHGTRRPSPADKRAGEPARLCSRGRDAGRQVADRHRILLIRARPVHDCRTARRRAGCSSPSPSWRALPGRCLGEPDNPGPVHPQRQVP
jgi:hypothetical protein